MAANVCGVISTAANAEGYKKCHCCGELPYLIFDWLIQLIGVAQLCAVWWCLMPVEGRGRKHFYIGRF